MRRATALGAAIGLVMVGFVALPTSPAGAAQLTGTTNANGRGGSCNVRYHGLDGNQGAGFRMDVVCNGVIPAADHIGGLSNVPFPLNNSNHWTPVGFSGVGTATNAACDIDGTAEVGYWWSPYPYPGTSGCDNVTNPMAIHTWRYHSFGAPFTVGGNSFKAVQFGYRINVVQPTNPANGQLADLGVRAYTNDAQELGWMNARITAGDVMFRVAIRNGAGTVRTDQWDFAGGLGNEGLSQNTPPDVPPDYFTGGSQASTAPCQKISWTGPPGDTTWQAGSEYTFVVAYTSAGTIKWEWVDGEDPAYIEIPATGSPQTLHVTARKTGPWLPIIHCVQGAVEETWGHYTNVDDPPPGSETSLANCFNGTGIGISPASWVPALGRVTGCTLRALFVPSGAGTGAFQDAVDGSVVEAAGGIQTTFSGAWGALSDAADANDGGCEGPSFTLPIEALDSPHVALMSTCSAPASTFAPIVRGFLLFGLALMVLAASLRGIGRVVGSEGGV